MTTQEYLRYIIDGYQLAKFFMSNAIDSILKSILILLPGIFIFPTWVFLIGFSYLSGELSLLQIIGYLATLVVGVIIGIISWAFPYWWSRPKLKILVDRPLKSGTLITHTLIVKNTGRSAAINCIGSITIQNATMDDLITEFPSELDKYKQALAEPLPKSAGPIRYHLTKETFREVKDEKLCWSDIGNPARITINPALVSGLDIYRVKPDEKHLYFP